MTTTASSNAESFRNPAAALAARPGLARPLASLLLAATVAALAAVAEQWVDAWSGGHLLMAWLVVWTVVSVAILLIAGTARRIALRMLAGLAGWTFERQQARAEAMLGERDHGDECLRAGISPTPDPAACSACVDEYFSASALRRRRALALM